MQEVIRASGTDMVALGWAEDWEEDYDEDGGDRTWPHRARPVPTDEDGNEEDQGDEADGDEGIASIHINRGYRVVYEFKLSGLQPSGHNRFVRCIPIEVGRIERVVWGGWGEYSAL